MHDAQRREDDEHDAEIEYEEGPLGVTLNVLIGCIRGAVYVPTLIHLCAAVPMTISLMGSRCGTAVLI